jgi:hypothetical protein
MESFEHIHVNYDTKPWLLMLATKQPRFYCCLHYYRNALREALPSRWSYSVKIYFDTDKESNILCRTSDSHSSDYDEDYLLVYNAM